MGFLFPVLIPDQRDRSGYGAVAGGCMLAGLRWCVGGLHWEEGAVGLGCLLGPLTTAGRQCSTTAGGNGVSVILLDTI